MSGPDPTEAAWGEFRARLHGFVARRVASPADAEDIVQAVFLRMHASLASLRGGEHLGAWLHRTARNAIADHYRAPRRRRETAAGDAGALDELRAPAEHEHEPAGRACATECLGPLVGRLPAAYRRAVELVELQGLTQQAAARSEGLSLSGMKARVQRARRRLKALLLERCRVALDPRGGVLGCEPQGGPAERCGPTSCAGEPRRS